MNELKSYESYYIKLMILLKLKTNSNQLFIL